MRGRSYLLTWGSAGWLQAACRRTLGWLKVQLEQCIDGGQSLARAAHDQRVDVDRAQRITDILAQLREAEQHVQERVDVGALEQGGAAQARQRPACFSAAEGRQH